jgi:hypothetical protein
LLIPVLKLAISALSLFAYIAVSVVDVGRISEKRFWQVAASLWCVTRATAFVVAFVVLDLTVESDVGRVYYRQAEAVLRGETVYRDFFSSYSPGFPYLLSLPLRLWHSPKSIVLFSILIEALSLLVWGRVIRRLWPAAKYRRAVLYYLLSGFAILNVAIAGQNQVWITLCLGLGVLLFIRGRRFWSGFAVSCAVVGVKFLPILYFAAFLRLRSDRALRTLIGLAAPLLLALTFVLPAGIDLLQPVRAQQEKITSGNLPYLLGFSGPWVQLLSLAALAAVALYLVSRPGTLTGRQVAYALVALTVMLPLISQKFFATYLMMIYPVLCVIVAESANQTVSAARFGVLNTMAALEPSLWFRWLGGSEDNPKQLWDLVSLARARGELWQPYVFVLIELIAVALYAYYLVAASTAFGRELASERRAAVHGSSAPRARVGSQPPR